MVTNYSVWTVCPGCSNLIWDGEKGTLVKVENVFPPIKIKWCRLCYVSFEDNGPLYPGIKK
jgi:hypothetical protein